VILGPIEEPKFDGGEGKADRPYDALIAAQARRRSAIL
jgi:hypothetical protein